MDIISRLNNIQEKLADPVILEWALKRIEARRMFNPSLADEIEKSLFPSPVLRRLLEKDDPDTLESVFATVSPDRFADVVNLMVERWPQWEPYVAGMCAEHIAILAPEKAEELFRAYLTSEQSEKSVDDGRDIGVMNGLLAIAPQKGRELALTLIDLNLSIDDYLVEDCNYFIKLISLARVYGLPVLPSLIEKILTAQLPPVKFEKTLEALYTELTDDVFLFWHTINLSGQYTAQSFSSMRFLFRQNAPLHELDDLVTGRIHKHLPKAAAFLEKYCAEQESAAAVLAAYRSCKNDIKKENRRHVVQFMAAIGAACLARESIDLSGLTIEELLGQVDVDMQLRLFDEYVRNLMSFPKEDIVRLVHEAVQKSRGEFAKVNLMALMPKLGFPEFIPFLLDSLRSERSSEHQAAYVSLCDYGAAVEEPFIARFSTMNPSEKTDAIEVLCRVGGEISIQALLDAYHELRGENLRPWCWAALELPDPRYIKILEPELRRKQYWVDNTFLTLCLLFDQHHPQLIAVRKRVEEKCERKRFGSEKDFADVVPLELQCPLCRDINEYEIKHVLVNPLRPDDPPYFPDEITCLSCGRVAEMALTSKAQTILMMQVSFAALRMRLNLEPEGAVKLVRSLDALPLKGLLENYQAALAKNPDSIPDMIGLANCYDKLDRIDEAERLYRRCWELDKTCIEAASKIADLLIHRNKRRAAFEILTESLQQRGRWKFYKTDNKRQATHIIMGMYDSLKEELSPEDDVSVNPAAIPTKKNPTVGRNDPCPCGSGKKYKRCCLGHS